MASAGPQGTVIANMSNARAILNRITYNGFGGITNQTGSGSQDRYKYTGREQDPDSGYQFHRRRYYDTRTGRWTSRDPIGFGADDPNLYRYVGNNPFNLIDPTGLAGWDPYDTWANQLKGSTPTWLGYKDKWFILKPRGWKIAKNDSGTKYITHFIDDNNVSVDVTASTLKRLGYKNGVRNQWAVDFATRTIYIDADWDTSAAEFFRNAIDHIWANRGLEHRYATYRKPPRGPQSAHAMMNRAMPGRAHQWAHGVNQSQTMANTALIFNGAGYGAGFVSPSNSVPGFFRGGPGGGGIADDALQSLDEVSNARRSRKVGPYQRQRNDPLQGGGARASTNAPGRVPQSRTLPGSAKAKKAIEETIQDVRGGRAGDVSRGQFENIGQGQGGRPHLPTEAPPGGRPPVYEEHAVVSNKLRDGRQVPGRHLGDRRIIYDRANDRFFYTNNIHEHPPTDIELLDQ